MNYKALKKIIKGDQEEEEEMTAEESIQEVNAATHEIPQSLQEARKTKFFFRLERELEKVNAFYLGKENELKIRLNALCKKTTTSHALKDAFLQFQVDLEKLQKFVQINATGFRKILKKWDKRSKASTKEIYLSRQVEIQPVFNTDVLTTLQDQAATFLQDLEMKLKSSDGEHEEVYLECPPQVVGFLEMNQPDLLKGWVEKHDLPLSRLFLDYCTETSIECLQVLLESNRVDCNLRDDISDHTCLHLLAIDGRLPALQLCLKFNAKISLDYYGRNPLHYAAMRGHDETCKYLLTLSGSQDILNQPDQDGNTPLIYAITSGHISVLQALIESGASIEPHLPNQPSFLASTPNQFSQQHHLQTKIPLTVACQSGHISVVQYLLSLTTDLTTIPPTQEGLYPLHLSCRQGQAEITEFLISHIQNTPNITPDQVQMEIDRRDAFTGWTPLFFAAAEGHVDCIRILLAAGCRVDLKDDGGWSVRTYCLYRGHMNAAALLLEYEEKLRKESEEALLRIALEEKNAGVSSIGFENKGNEERLSGGTLDAITSDGIGGAVISNNLNGLDLDDIPSLSLPPPIIPLRIYGHHYLDNKYLVQIHLGKYHAGPSIPGDFQHQQHPVTLSGSRQLYSLKLKISVTTDRDHAFFANLPLKEDVTTYSYTTSTLSNSSIEFDLFPVFGTVAIGRACLPSSQFHALIMQSRDGVTMPESTIALFDTHLRVLGHVSFRISLVRPFLHPSLAIGGQIETYWKSTTVVSNPPLGTSAFHGGMVSGSMTDLTEVNAVHSLVTASSLVEEYIEIIVQPTRDCKIVIYPHATVPVVVGAKTVDIPISSLTFEEALEAFKVSKRVAKLDDISVSDSSFDVAKKVYGFFLTLDEALKVLPSLFGLSVILQYPDLSDFDNSREQQPWQPIVSMNVFVNKVLQISYDYSNKRSLIFSSFNQTVCTILNWKQPNYGVFFRTYCGIENEESRRVQKTPSSIKESVKFAKTCALLGIVCESLPLVDKPELVQTIKESGLMLASFGPANTLPLNIEKQERSGIDATISGYVFKYTNVL